MDSILDFMRELVHPGLEVPDSFYKAKRLVSKLHLSSVRIDCCENDCMLYFKGDANLEFCKFCQHHRYKRGSIGKQIAIKAMHYLPLIPRLKRLYASYSSAPHMRWHSENRRLPGIMCHPSDGDAWKHLGRVSLKNPHHTFWLIETGDYDSNNGLPPIAGRRIFFGREIGAADRKLMPTYQLKSRNFLGPTAMDAEMAFLMANQAQAKAGRLVYDPFVGTGSILVAATHYGAITMGVDIDIRVVRDGRGPDVMSGATSSSQDSKSVVEVLYGERAIVHADVTGELVSNGGEWCDCHLRSSNEKGNNNNIPSIVPQVGSGEDRVYTDLTTPWQVFDAIVCDPPYGVRAGGRNSGGRKLLKGVIGPYTVPDDKRTGHIPSTAPYSLVECVHDLLDLAAKMLVLGGRLVYFYPVVREDESIDTTFPEHPFFKLVATSEQVLSYRYSRVLLTMVKIGPYTEEIALAARIKHLEFKENHLKWLEEGNLHSAVFSPADNHLNEASDTKISKESKARYRGKYGLNQN
ncbi:hypothetical protein FXO37_06107 [Capsicum annuum]|nr:hypothetical protein FXO37_06107 [Capsicum annuum]